MKQLFGQVLCCDSIPEYGGHSFHAYEGRTGLPGFGFYCHKCHKSHSILTNTHYEQDTIGFALTYWNRQFQPCQATETRLELPKLNAPAGYRWATLRLDYAYIGGTKKRSWNFVLFKTKVSDLLNRKWKEDGKLADLRIMNIFGEELDLSWLHDLRNVGVYFSKAWCTDNTSWYSMSISMCNTAQKHLRRFESEMTPLGYNTRLFEYERV